MVRIVEQGNEAEPQIELAGRTIDRIYLHSPNTDVLGEVLRSPLRIDEQERAKTLALYRSVHGQPSEQNDGNIQPK